QPALVLVSPTSVAAHPVAPGALQPAARPRLPLHRLRALHHGHEPRPARARGPLVVGRRDEARARPPPTRARGGAGHAVSPCRRSLRASVRGVTRLRCLPPLHPPPHPPPSRGRESELGLRV